MSSLELARITMKLNLPGIFTKDFIRHISMYKNNFGLDCIQHGANTRLEQGIPGIKLGLANLVPLVIMYRMDARYAFAANLIRVLLAGLLFSGLFAALYSLAGSCVSFLIMYLAKKTDRFSIIGVSMAGGVFHNLGQLAVAIILVSGQCGNRGGYCCFGR